MILLLVVFALVYASSSSSSSSSSSASSCSSAEAVHRFTKAFEAMWPLNDAVHPPTMEFFAGMLSKNAQMVFQVGGTAVPNILVGNYALASRFRPGARITATDVEQGTITFTYHLRIVGPHGVPSTFEYVKTKIWYDSTSCHATKVVTDFSSINPAASSAVRMFLSAVPEDRSCPVGELRLSEIPALKSTANTTNDDCVPISCRSVRACDADVVCVRRTKAAAAAAGGIGFTCGCAKGYAANLHQRICVPVTCEAPDACTPLAKCVMMPADELTEYCNPTPTMSAQWVRGSKPCPRFRCLPK